FGVVDPNLSEQVGVLNFSWLNQNAKLKSVVSAEDPAEALREQLDYFDAWYAQQPSQSPNQRRADDQIPHFAGLKVLLAQTNPEWVEEAEARADNSQSKDELKKRVEAHLSECLSQKANKAAKYSEQLKWMTLCAMRQRTGADVALIQKRDFFFDDLQKVHND